MDRVWKSGAVGAPPPLDNASVGYPTAGNPGTGTPATKPGPHWFHMMNEELLSVIGAAGIAFDKTDVGQVLKALKVFGLLGGLSGGGIGQFKFPAVQNASGDPNTFDDYEEGAWTPTDGSGAGVSFVGPGPYGSYLKGGQLVIAAGEVVYPGTASGAQATIGGLPFASITYANAIFGGFVTRTDAGFEVLVSINSSQSQVNLRKNDDSSVTNANMSGKRVHFVAIYRAAS